MESKISACLVIKDEELVLGRCLESIKDIVSEIIIIHDGPCHDKSLDIAKRYNAKVFIQPFNGEAEKHRIFSFQKAQYEWILQIDADEYFEKETGKTVKEIVRNPNIDLYKFRWPYYNGKTYTKGFYSNATKPILFRKNKMYFIGISHESPQTYGRTEIRLDLTLKHKPSYNNFTFTKLFTKWFKWTDIQAKEIINIEKATTFNILSKNNKTIEHYKRLRKHSYSSIIKNNILLDFIKKIKHEDFITSNLTTWKTLLLIYINDIYLAHRFNYYKGKDEK